MAAGAFANLESLIRNDLMANARTQGRLVRDELDALILAHGSIISQVRGKGLMQAIVFADETGTAKPELASAVQELCKDKGLLVGLGGVDWNVVRLAPPLIVSESETKTAMTILRSAVEAVACLK